MCLTVRHISSVLAVDYIAKYEYNIYEIMLYEVLI